MARRIRAREVLRLRSVNGLSQNAIARTAHVSKHSVQDVLEAARERGVSWEDVEGMSEEAAYALLFPGRGDAGPVHADPDWARVHRELAKTGVTLALATGKRSPRYRDVEPVLRSGQDRAPAGEASGDCGYVRGAGFYGEE